MIKETIYKTEDGHTFTSEKDALKYEETIKAKNEKEAKKKAELDSLRKKRDAAYKLFEEAYNNYTEANTAYHEKYKEYHNINTDFFDQILNSIFN